jgi:hypothetical protein
MAAWASAMKRRHALLALATTAAAGRGLSESGGRAGELENPYEEIDWDRCEQLDSMSHQHQGQTEASREVFFEMGYRHFAFSNYYPSAPTYPLPESYLARRPEIAAAPNAEQHSFTDSPLHANSLGSLLATGYGGSVGNAALRESPIRHRFEGVRPYDAERRPWEGVYRLDLRLEARGKAVAGEPLARLSVEGAGACAPRGDFADEGEVRDKPFGPGNHTLYLRAGGTAIELGLDFDPAALRVTQLRLMQGTNRPWREVFRAILDGEEADGRREGGLLDPDGGGITLNHPTGRPDDYLEMLDFDPRVLGIEVWNQLTSGFGSSRGFYEAEGAPPLHFYRLWDEILATGRRCWGFFVKDHNTYGRGRNVLVVPPRDGLSRPERESLALRAYRRGAFYGSVAAIATDEEGRPTMPYDRSGFRFRRLELRRDAKSRAEALRVAVAGNDPGLRPQVQIRFVSDAGIAGVVDGPEAEFPLPRDGEGRLVPAFVRVEAFAYPTTHLLGEPLGPEEFTPLDVAAISRLHDRHLRRGEPGFFGNPAELSTPLPVVDMLFSQPFRRV